MHVLSDDLVRAIERTRVEYRFLRLERLSAAALPSAGELRIARFGAAYATDWEPMPRVFCLDHRDIERLDEVLAWFEEAGRSPHFELLPLDGNRPLFDALAERGFAPRYTISVLVTEPEGAAPVGPSIRLSPDDEIRAWCGTYIEAHDWERTDAEHDEWVAELIPQYLHPSIARYVAEVDGEIAAIAASYHPGGQHAHLTNCAVLQRFRGRGLHAGLIRQRLHDLSLAGVVHAAADTAPYSRSHGNLERAGFRVAYQKTHWERRTGS
jgi:hypothetical protein